MLGGPTAADLRLTSSLNKIVNHFGMEADVRHLYQASNAISNMFYMGTLGSPIGGRPLL